MSLKTATRSSRSATELSAGRSAAHCATQAASPAARGPQARRWHTSSIHGKTSIQRGSWGAAGPPGAEASATGVVREASHAPSLPRAVPAVSGTGPLPTRNGPSLCVGGRAVPARGDYWAADPMNREPSLSAALMQIDPDSTGARRRNEHSRCRL
jgi:hypothetical protein